jgi:hypothetical protein
MLGEIGVGPSLEIIRNGDFGIGERGDRFLNSLLHQFAPRKEAIGLVELILRRNDLRDAASFSLRSTKATNSSECIALSSTR